MSFTSDVKQELSLKKPEGNEERAELSALIQMTSSISISSRGMAIAVVTENASVSRAVYRMLKNRYEVTIETSVRRRMNLNKNLIYTLKVYGQVNGILTDLGLYSARGLLDRPLQKIVQKDSFARAYLAGAFMADGSVNSPQTSSYHLEIKACNEKHAQFLMDLLSRFDIPSRCITRRSKSVVYLKASERIADFLRVCGADECLLEFENERISRDLMNNVQRLNNVDVANEVKSMKASNNQIEDIEVLKKYDRLKSLDIKVKDAAELRLANPDATLSELAELYNKENGTSVTKSGMKHRFVKIHDLAEELRKTHGE
ncbi:MAG: DNA-binding protein WhiA [Solobacterium sp.]|nr:DNA-binding protein WhiA [Solobacterium sp.]